MGFDVKVFHSEKFATFISTENIVKGQLSPPGSSDGVDTIERFEVGHLGSF